MFTEPSWCTAGSWLVGSVPARPCPAAALMALMVDGWTEGLASPTVETGNLIF